MVNLNKKSTTVKSDTSWFWDNSAVKISAFVALCVILFAALIYVNNCVFNFVDYVWYNGFSTEDSSNLTPGDSPTLVPRLTGSGSEAYYQSPTLTGISGAATRLRFYVDDLGLLWVGNPEGGYTQMLDEDGKPRKAEIVFK